MLGRRHRLACLATIFGGIEALAASQPSLPNVGLVGLAEPDVVDVSQVDGPFVLQFWASWCQSCETVFRDAAEVAENSKVPLLAVSLDETRAAAFAGMQKLKRGKGQRFFHDRGRRLAAALGDVGVPTVLAVDGDGKIVLRLTGHFGRAQLEHLRIALKRRSDSP